MKWPWERRAISDGFAAQMIASFPPTLAPPESLVKFFQWLEEEGLDETASFGGGCYARLDPSQRGSSLSVSPVDPNHAGAWMCGENVDAGDRLAAFVQTGGDGSSAALWRDDDGELHIVHLGSGSGSTMLCSLTTDPVDFLRLLAIGYDELCWPEQFALPPAQAYARSWGDEENIPPPPAVPLRLQKWVGETFGVTIPATAFEIVKRTANMDDDASDDPFWRWVRRIQGE